jgi:hypothetical protein
VAPGIVKGKVPHEEDGTMAGPFDDMMQASYRAQHARDLASDAYMEAIYCDREAARRLADRARAVIREVERMIAALPAAVRAAYGTDDATLDLLAYARGDLARIDGLLERCRPPAAGGTFADSRGQLEGQERRNTIAFVFTLTAPLECRHLCIVSVFHIEEDATGKTVDPPSKAYRDGFDPITGKPDEGSAVRGHVVDVGDAAWAEDASGRLVLVKNTMPCWPSSKVDGLRVTAEDSPTFLKDGYTAYFETCLVCLDPTPPSVLGCCRWKHTNGSSELQTPADFPGPSAHFRDALTRWLERRK